MRAANRLALILSLTAFGATSLDAAEITRPDDEVTNAVRVVNNYHALVRVYAEDAEGRLHKLGRVARGQLVEFEIPEEVLRDSFRIRIQPSQPVWSLSVDNFSVKTNPLNLQGDADVTVWVEPSLANSKVEMTQG